MEPTAMVVATTKGKKLERKIRNIAGRSPMPNQSMAKGIHASGDMGRKKLMSGLTNSWRKYSFPGSSPREYQVLWPDKNQR